MVEDGWWSQHGETAIGVLAGALVTLVVGFWIFYLQRRRKTLDWIPLTNAPLINSVLGFGGEVLVLIDGARVVKPHIVTIRIKNTGRESIMSEDYDGPLSIYFRSSQLAGASIAERASSGIQVEFVESGVGEIDGRFEVRPGMMNAGEWFDVQFLFDGGVDYPTVSARFANQTRSMRRLSSDSGKAQFAKALAQAMSGSVRPYR